jgi:hypothetical protein
LQEIVKGQHLFYITKQISIGVNKKEQKGFEIERAPVDDNLFSFSLSRSDWNHYMTTMFIRTQFKRIKINSFYLIRRLIHLRL